MKKIIKYTFVSLLVIILLPIVFSVALYLKADMGEPEIIFDKGNYITTDSVGYKSCNGNYLRQNTQGLWEAYLHGNAIDRGAANGSLTKELLYFQEKVFIDQINEIVPSESYLKFLRFFTIIFNRNLGEYIPYEYREEIWGISQFCTDEYNAIGSPYERQLNFHAAHDIGHTMQEYMLVGCSSFAVWKGKSADSSLLIGRNFDFYVGDDFAKNKLISFVTPEQGYKFAAVGWAGMIGVLSGMNEKGLTVTINASKGSIPTSAAMPISILAREILQYASTINEAYEIAKKHHTFVSESLLIGSAIDGKAVIIEKTPSKIGLFESDTNQVICTNHYQSDSFKNDPVNIENKERSDSYYRFRRIETLLNQIDTLNYSDVAMILRDRKGIEDQEIGLANEKSLNQYIAHHSVIFKPEQRLMWVSTYPWQSGEYICYDLNKIFGAYNPKGDNDESDYRIASDTLFLKGDYKQLIDYRMAVKQIKTAIKSKNEIDETKIQQLIDLNPELYYVYQLLGDYYAAINKNNDAKKMWNKALAKEIPRVNERESIEEKIRDHE